MKNSILTLGILVTLLYACKEELVDDNIQSSNDHLYAEAIFNDIANVVEKGLKEYGVNTTCVEYNLINDSANFNSILEINFGNTNCLYNGKLRRGKMLIHFTGEYRDSSSIITTNFDQYYINNNLIQGEITITNKGKNNNGNFWFTLEVKNGTVSRNNGTINWESSITKEWMEGSETLDRHDDIYTISGSANGIGVNNTPFSTIITTPLNVAVGCFSSATNCIIKSGEAKISPNGYADRIINYGNGLCDCNVDVIINGITYSTIIDN